jgi:lysophospholipase L1-like esterase
MSEDGVHPTGLGHGIIAAEWLKALGMKLPW